ncbi:MAG: HD domain-containing protein [Chloroflexota bacterium]
MSKQVPPLWHPIHGEFRELIERFTVHAPELYIVGGAVRDLLLPLASPHSDDGKFQNRKKQSGNKPTENKQAEEVQQEFAQAPEQAVHIPDLDLLVPKNACRIARQVADEKGWAYYPLDLERDIARLVCNRESSPLVCDVARFQGSNLYEDLAGRDFTINAMALRIDGASFQPDNPKLYSAWFENRGLVSPIESAGNASFQSDCSIDTQPPDTQKQDIQRLNERKIAREIVAQTPGLIDHFGGFSDLKRRFIRRVSDQAIPQDPARLLRAVRLSAQLGFQIEEETLIQIVDLAPLISQISHERIRDELWKALATSDPATVLNRLDELGLLALILPEITTLKGVPQSAPHTLNVFNHTLWAVRYAGFLRDWLLQDNIHPSSKRSGERIEHEPIHPSIEACLSVLVERLSPWREKLATHFQIEPSVGHKRAEWLVWFALFHDIGKPKTRSEEVTNQGETKQRFFEHEQVGADLVEPRLQALHFSRDELKLVDKVILAHMRPHHLHVSFEGTSVSHRACFRFFRDVGKIQRDSLVGIDVLLLALADFLAIHGPVGPTEPTTLTQEKWLAYLEHVTQLLAYAMEAPSLPGITSSPLINGNMLMERLSIEPGPLVGRLLGEVAEAQAAEEIQTVDEAIAWCESRIVDLQAQ